MRNHIEHKYDIANDALKHSPFQINNAVRITINSFEFRENFDMYVNMIDFDLSPYHMKMFNYYVCLNIANLNGDNDWITNSLTIGDLIMLTLNYEVFLGYNRCSKLIKVCPKIVKYEYNDDNPYHLNVEISQKKGRVY